MRISSMQILHCTNRFKGPIFETSEANEGKQPSGRQRRWSAAPEPGKDPDESSMEFGAAHSSSQRPSDTIGNTPPPSCQSPSMTLAGPPPPAGVILFSPSSSLLQPIATAAQYLRIFPPILRLGMRFSHGCHETSELHKFTRLNYLQLIDRGGALPAPLDLDRQHSSSQLPIRTKRRSLDLLPQRALFDSGTASSLCHLLSRCRPAAALTARYPHDGQREACVGCMGAMQHCLCNFCSNRLYSGSSDDGQPRDKRWQTTLERIGS
ncbi:hypothetical protein ABIE33_000015 [Ensifer sp. 4252]